MNDKPLPERLAEIRVRLTYSPDLLCTRDEIDLLFAEIDRLNKWADGFSDAQMKERRTGEEYQRELKAQVTAAEAERDALQSRVAELEEALGSLITDPWTGEFLAPNDDGWCFYCGERDEHTTAPVCRAIAAFTALAALGEAGDAK